MEQVLSSRVTASGAVSKFVKYFLAPSLVSIVASAGRKHKAGLDLNRIPSHCENTIVERTSNGEIKLCWLPVDQEKPARHRIDYTKISVANSVEGLDTAGFDRVSGHHTVIKNLDFSKRYFFKIDPIIAPAWIVGERIIPLQGTRNCRDVGGYKTLSGKKVRWGTLYRSDSLIGLGRRGKEFASQLNIDLVLDFRGEFESEYTSAQLPPSDKRKTVNLPMYYEWLDPVEILNKLVAGNLDEVDFQKQLIAAYRSFTLDFRVEFREAITHMIETEGAIVMNCTGGKDRTGVVMALLLTLLGVPKETVYYDYLLTNDFTEYELDRNLRLTWLASLCRMDRENLRPALQARTCYLDSAFEAVNDEYGSVDAYFRESVGLTDDMIRALKNKLLA